MIRRVSRVKNFLLIVRVAENLIYRYVPNLSGTYLYMPVLPFKSAQSPLLKLLLDYQWNKYTFKTWVKNYFSWPWLV